MSIVTIARICSCKSGSFATRLGFTCVAKGRSQCSLKNAPPAGDFHWLMLQCCPAHGRSASYRYKSLLLHLYHIECCKSIRKKTTTETRSSRFEQLYRWTCARLLKCSLNIAICIISFVRKYFTDVQLMMH